VFFCISFLDINLSAQGIWYSTVKLHGRSSQKARLIFKKARLIFKKARLIFQYKYLRILNPDYEQALNDKQ
jgi:hypothetical protein